MVNASEASHELVQLRTLGTQGAVQLFERYRSRLARMVVLRLDSRIIGKVDVEDVLQDAVMEAARRIEDYLDRPTVPFFVWLRTITSQILIDVHRRYLGAQMRDVKREMSLDKGIPEEDIFLDAGLAPERLILEPASRTTAENASASLAVRPDEREGEWLLVTSGFHMPRAIETFCAAGWTDLTAWPTDFRSDPAPGGITWGFLDRLSKLDLAMKEYVGLLAYRLTGRSKELSPEGC